MGVPLADDPKALATRIRQLRQEIEEIDPGESRIRELRNMRGRLSAVEVCCLAVRKCHIQEGLTKYFDTMFEQEFSHSMVQAPTIIITSSHERETQDVFWRQRTCWRFQGPGFNWIT